MNDEALDQPLTNPITLGLFALLVAGYVAGVSVPDGHLVHTVVQPILALGGIYWIVHAAFLPESQVLLWAGTMVFFYLVAAIFSIVGSTIRQALRGT